MDPAVLRDDMVAGLEHDSKRVLESEALSVAFRTVPREAFVPDERGAYADRSFEQYGTKVLAPSTVARLFEVLDPQEGDSVLVVGAGVGYTAAVCAQVVGARNVHAVDIARRLVWEARDNLGRAGYGAVLVDRRNGERGLPEYAPFDRVLLEAAAIRPPDALLSQLAPGGRLVMPLGLGEQRLVAIENGAVASRHGAVSFAPLLIEGERSDTVERNRTTREDREFAERAAERRRGWEHEWIDWDR
ncbi:protein-L-isoaspartate O-methyltransferase [Halobacteriales archaeon QS_8_65_32]|nr:MAG: protein-L-isoaspartate O-methyltransferase [Halobacteriales archaeon QS_8_65_32]